MAVTLNERSCATALYAQTYTGARMVLEWDPHKAASSLRKHGVRFTDAYGVLEDPHALTVDDPHPQEARYLTLGMDTFGRLLIVSYTWRENRIRIISVRKATPAEQRQYEEGL